MITDILVGRPGPHTFPLTVDDFDAALAERFPGVQVVRDELAGGEPYSEFYAVVDGVERSGMFWQAGSLVLKEGDGQVWAPTIEWFLKLVPGYPVEMVTEASHPRSLPIPAGSTADEISELYDLLAAGS